MHRPPFAIFIVLFCLLPLVAVAAEPPTAPILRIDPDEHTAAIICITTDAAGRCLVTAPVLQ